MNIAVIRLKASRRISGAALALTMWAVAPAAADTEHIGEIRQLASNYCPTGWLPLDGRLLPIPENETLFQLIGTTYGGDGATTFALPAVQPTTTLINGAPYTMCIALFGVFPSPP
jgi:microcystin-dependent protein